MAILLTEVENVMLYPHTSIFKIYRKIKINLHSGPSSILVLYIAHGNAYETHEENISKASP